MKSCSSSEIVSRIKAGGVITRAEAVALLKGGEPLGLHEAAHELTEFFRAPAFDFCAIINARSGKCSENCKWCAQSAHWHTGCEIYSFVGAEKCAEEAQKVAAKGVGRIAIVTSGRGQTDRQVDEICDALHLMGERAEISLCASLGLVTKAQLAKLKAAGLKRIHCNLESAPSRFKELCTTHTIAEKLATIKAAREVGLEVCSGGIIGMGESDEELVDFGFLLSEIAPDSIPVNILHPIKGTPLGDSPRLTLDRILDSIAILRLINPKTPLRFAGGSRDLKREEIKRCMYVGMNAGIYGPLLTTDGMDFSEMAK